MTNLRGILTDQGKRIVFTNGCFDILHRGHIEYLQKARQLGDTLFVGINSDESVRRLKGKSRPLLPVKDRALLVAALEMVNYVSIFPEDTPLELITSLQPDVLVKGGDYQINDIVGGDVVKNRGGQVVTIPLVAGQSTSNIIRKIVDLTKKGILN